MSVTGRLTIDVDGRPVRAHGIVADVTRRVRAEEALRASEERLRLALAAGRIGVWDYHVDADRVTWSSSAVPAAAVAAPAEPRTLEDFFALVDPRDRGGVRAAIDAALSGDASYHTEMRLAVEGPPVWIETRASVLRDREGRAVRMIGVDRDVTAEKAAEAHLRSLAAEYDHRTRNVFQIVQALVVQSLSPGPERRRLLDRLGAMFRAHGAAAGGAGDLEETVRLALSPYPPDRIAVTGPPVALSPPAASTLVLVFHELATNAAKYGALGEEDGRVDVAWRVEGAGGPEARLSLQWRETAGRPIAPPARQGFGTQLVTESIASALGGTAALDYPPSGLLATFTIPSPPSRRLEGRGERGGRRPRGGEAGEDVAQLVRGERLDEERPSLEARGDRRAEVAGHEGERNRALDERLGEGERPGPPDAQVEEGARDLAPAHHGGCLRHVAAAHDAAGGELGEQRLQPDHHDGIVLENQNRRQTVIAGLGQCGCEQVQRHSSPWCSSHRPGNGLAPAERRHATISARHGPDLRGHGATPAAGRLSRRISTECPGGKRGAADASAGEGTGGTWLARPLGWGGPTSGACTLDTELLRPALILGVLAFLIVLNVIEFRGKRRRDAADMEALALDERPEIRLARKQYLQTQNIEQVAHIINSVLIALLVAVLTA